MYKVISLPLVFLTPATGLVLTTLPSGTSSLACSFCWSAILKPSFYKVFIASLMSKPETSGTFISF